MNYKQAALDELSRLPGTDREFRKSLVYAILSLGQTDEVEEVCIWATEFILADTPEKKQESLVGMDRAVRELVSVK